MDQASGLLQICGESVYFQTWPETLSFKRAWSQHTDRTDFEGNKNVSTVLRPKALAQSTYSVNVPSQIKKIQNKFHGT